MDDCDYDCNGGSDETSDDKCFQCADGSKLVKRKYLCDGYVDCHDMSDESPSDTMSNWLVLTHQNALPII